MISYRELPGEKVPKDRLSATEVNQVVNAVRQLLTTDIISRLDRGVDSGIPANWVWANNTGEVEIDPFRPVGITGQVFTGTDQDQADKRTTELVLEVINPKESTINFEGHFAIAAEHISPGNSGRVWDSGICPAWAVSNEGEAEGDGYGDEEGEEFTFAELLHQEDSEGNPTLGKDYLTCSSGGSSRIIWKKESGSPNEQLIIMRLGFASVMVTPTETVVVKITSKVNYNTYIADEYENGIDVAATGTNVTIKVLQIANTETIPDGTYLPAFLLPWGSVTYRTINVARDY